MNTVDDLRDMFDEYASEAHDGRDLVPAVQAGAGRVRRRRRIVQSVTAVAAVLAVTAGVPLVLGADEPSTGGGTAVGGEPTATAPREPVATSYRRLTALTVSLAPDSVYFPMIQGTEGNRQFIVARNRVTTDTRHQGGAVYVHDPGTFDRKNLQDAEEVTVNGQQAYYSLQRRTRLQLVAPGPQQQSPQPAPPGPSPVAPGTLDPSPVPSRARERTVDRVPQVVTASPAEFLQPTLSWQDSSGAWVMIVVGADQGRSAALHLAQAVRLSAPRAARTPFQLGWLPDGLPVASVSSRADANGADPAKNLNTYVGLGTYVGDPQPTSDELPGDAPWGRQLIVEAATRAGSASIHDELWDGPATRTVGGHPAWYRDSRSDDGARSGYRVGIKVGTCVVVVYVEQAEKVGLADVDRMVADMTFGSCVDLATWRPVLR